MTEPLEVDDVPSSSSRCTIQTYEEIKVLLEGANENRLNLLCNELNMKLSSNGDLKELLTPFQLSSLLSIVLVEIVPGYKSEQSIREWNLMLATILLNCVFRGSMGSSWERIILQLVRRDLLSSVHDWREGIVAKTYTIAFPLSIECAINDDCIGIRRLATQYDIGCSIINFRDELGWGIMHHAAYNKSLRLIRFLFENHISVNERTCIDRLTPLHIAAKMHYYDLIEPLIGFGAIVGIKSATGQTALDLLLATAALRFRRTTIVSAGKLWQAISILLPSQEDLWVLDAPISSSSLLSRITCTCNVSVIEGVVQLANRVDPAIWNLDALLFAIVGVLRKKNASCSICLIKSFKDYLLSSSRQLSGSKSFSFLFGEAVRSSLVQVVSLLCETLDISKSRIHIFLNSHDIRSFVNICVLRGDLSMCKCLVENVRCNEDYIFHRELESTENITGLPHRNSLRFTSLHAAFAPMSLSILKHDVALAKIFLCSR